MLVCNVSLRPSQVAIAATIAETATAVDATATGNVVFAALVDDPASVGDIVDAYLGEIMLEVASADANAYTSISADVVEAAAAASTQDATVVSAALVLDGIANLTGAWSLSRDLRTSFAGGTRYTKSGTAVITLEDQSGNNRDFTDGGNTARRPVETTAFPTGVLCADFDGVQTSLDTSALISSFITNSSGAMVVSVIIDAVSTNSATPYSNHGVIADTGTFLGLHARNLSGVTFIAYNWDGTADQATTTGTTGTPYVLMWRHHGGNIYVSVNGGTEISVASGNTTTISAFLRLGNSGGVGTFCNMKFAEGFCTSDGSQTAALATAIANMKTYIGA